MASDSKKTPSGVWTLGEGFYIGEKPDTDYPMFAITENTYWVTDEKSKFFNKKVEGTDKKDWNKADHMIASEQSYKYGIVVNYNTDEPVTGKGSAVFIHCGDKPTEGCIAVPEDVMKTISRRDFLKGIAGGAGIAAVSAFTGNSALAEAPGIYTPGTYSATAQGIGTVTVTMTFDANSILDVILDVSGETPSIGQLHADELKEALMSSQSAEIDAVSGASVTSNAVKKAAEACIAQAKGEAVVLTEKAEADYEIPAELSAEDVAGSGAQLGTIIPDEVMDYDVVVVGAGAAGVPAAGSAVLEGARVALLQKQSVVVSQGNCIGAAIKEKSDLQGMMNFIHHTNSLSDWRSDRKQVQTFIDYSEPAVNWILEMSGLTGGENPEAGLSIYMQNDVTYTGVFKDRILCNREHPFTLNNKVLQLN